MKKSERYRGWRPVGGAILVGALAFAVGAYAAPRTTDDAASRGTKEANPVRSQAAQLVTGSPEHLQSVVAGTGVTTLLRVRPVNIPSTATPPNSPQMYTVAGQVLTASAGGFRAWFQYEVGNWDPTGDGPGGDGTADPDEFPGTVQIQIDASGYMDSDTSDVGTATGDDGDAPDLAPAVVACVANAPCTNTGTGFSQSWAVCESLFCKASYVDGAGAGPNSYCADFGFGNCVATGSAACDTSSFNHRCFALTSGPRPDLGDGSNCLVTDCDGSEKYFASLVLDIPVGALGRYTVGLNSLSSYLKDFATTPNPEVDDYDISARQGFEVNIVTGSCCYDLTGAGGCTDGLLQSECGDDEVGPFVWSADKACADGCVECVNDAGCDDGDSCSTETCNTALGVCSRGCVAGWDTATECCDGSGAAPVITPIDDGDACTADACSGGSPGACSSPGPSNGSATHTPALGPCDDGNACTTADACDGVNSYADGGCDGINVNSIACLDSSTCPINPFSGDPYDCVAGFCFCTLTPSLNYIITNSVKDGECEGGLFPGQFCETDADCPGGSCNEFADKGNCFEEGSKVAARVRMGSAGGPINGGQFLIVYDASCLQLNSIACVAPYLNQLYKAPASEASANGSMFIACGVDPFCVDQDPGPADSCDGPPGGADILALQFTKIGECNECELCFDSNNPQNTYLVDNEGQRVDVDDKCKAVRDNGDLTLTVPGCGASNDVVAAIPETPCVITINSDCDSPTGTISWDAPSASFNCGDASLACRGAHESGYAYPQSVVMNGGTLAQGASSFCCFAEADDPCGQTAGCAGSVNNCASYKGCWTVDVTDETSLDIHVQLEPPVASGTATRCIEFCLYGPCTDAPNCFQEDVTFGGLFNYVGKAGGKIKVPKGKWGCITAQDQLHSLRSCADPDCIGGQLIADFKGDPTYDGNWLIMGNLDGWKKGDPTANPSLDVIDILDFGTFVSQFGVCYSDPSPGCHEGPNADIDGDGCVTMADYNFVLKNFLASAKECCCGPQTGSISADPITEISVDELRQLGEFDLIAADLNGDGLVNAEDMNAFTQGVRPSKNGTGRGGKGLRSGR